MGIRLPGPIASSVKPTAPLKARLGVASGKLALDPAPKVSALTVLFRDPDSEVRKEARSALMKIPEAEILEALDFAELHGAVLDIIALLKMKNVTVVTKVAAHKNCAPKTLARLADSDCPETVEAVSAQAEKLETFPEIRETLELNPLYKDTSAKEEDAEGAAEEGAIPEELFEEDEPSLNIYEAIKNMNMAEKIKLATLGGKSARRILIKDTNKSVTRAVIHSPKIQEDEVAAIAKDKNMNEEIITIICQKRE